MVQDFDLYNIGNTIPGTISVECHTAPLLVGDLLGDACRFCGLSTGDFDFSAITDSLTGYFQDARTSGQELLNPILGAYALDLRAKDGIITAYKRGNAVDFTVTESDLGFSMDAQKLNDRMESTVLADRTELHSSLRVMFKNLNANFRTAGERKNRDTSAYVNQYSFATNLTLVPDDAAKMAGYLLASEWLEWLYLVHGKPEAIVSDNGPEFRAMSLPEGVSNRFIQPGKPWQNGYIESFFGKLRDELLSCEMFVRGSELQAALTEFAEHYNNHRPHLGLGGLTPAAFKGELQATKQTENL